MIEITPYLISLLICLTIAWALFFVDEFDRSAALALGFLGVIPIVNLFIAILLLIAVIFLLSAYLLAPDWTTRFIKRVRSDYTNDFSLWH